ncbi:hypothetical protein [Pedobacter gandavensis]|uniref:hypothetical protein n=1 Tax=Pedobacter gandavensis TaxID=2679963 RepID=UPI0029307A86|nr:hypothetical protein [Pedobacter gandavensis]
MAKRRSKKNRIGFNRVLISLGILFTAILFIIRVIFGTVSWFEVFAPVIIAFFIVFLLTALKSALRKV